MSGSSNRHLPDPPGELSAGSSVEAAGKGFSTKWGPAGADDPSPPSGAGGAEKRRGDRK